jgi:hypothetical protein
VIQLACGVAEGRLKIVGLQIRKLGKDLIGGLSGDNEVDRSATSSLAGGERSC